MIRELMFLLLYLSIHLVCADHLHASKVDYVTLKQIDLELDKVLHNIIQREVQQTDFTKEKVKYLSVHVKGDKEKANVTVISELFDSIDDDRNYLGYYLMNNKIIVHST